MVKPSAKSSSTWSSRRVRRVPCPGAETVTTANDLAHWNDREHVDVAILKMANEEMQISFQLDLMRSQSEI